MTDLIPQDRHPQEVEAEEQQEKVEKAAAKKALKDSETYDVRDDPAVGVLNVHGFSNHPQDFWGPGGDPELIALHEKDVARAERTRRTNNPQLQKEGKK